MITFASECTNKAGVVYHWVRVDGSRLLGWEHFELVWGLRCLWYRWCCFWYRAATDCCIQFAGGRVTLASLDGLYCSLSLQCHDRVAVIMLVFTYLLIARIRSKLHGWWDSSTLPLRIELILLLMHQLFKSVLWLSRTTTSMNQRCRSGWFFLSRRIRLCVTFCDAQVWSRLSLVLVGRKFQPVDFVSNRVHMLMIIGNWCVYWLLLISTCWQGC